MNKVLALDIGASSIKIAEFQSSETSGLRLTDFDYIELGIEPDYEENRKAVTVSALRTALSPRDNAAADVILSLSGHSVFTNFLILPPVDESKVIQIVQYELQHNIPLPADNITWDYQIIGTTMTGEQLVVALAVKYDMIVELVKDISSIGFRTGVVDVAPMALYNAVRYSKGNQPGCTMVIDIGAQATNLLFVESSGGFFSRSIPIAGNVITQSIAAEFSLTFLEAEQLKKSNGFVAVESAYQEAPNERQARMSQIIRDVMQRLHAEVATSIKFYKDHSGASPPARLLLAGGSSIMPSTDRFFQEKLELPVEHFDPLCNIDIDSSLSRDELGKYAHVCGELVGLGLRRTLKCAKKVNLLPSSLASPSPHGKADFKYTESVPATQQDTTRPSQVMRDAPTDISFTCDKCGQDILVDESAAGATVNCPSCGGQLVIPQKIRLGESSAPMAPSTWRTQKINRKKFKDLRGAHSVSTEARTIPFETKLADWIQRLINWIRVPLIGGILWTGLSHWYSTRGATGKEETWRGIHYQILLTVVLILCTWWFVDGLKLPKGSKFPLNILLVVVVLLLGEGLKWELVLHGVIPP
jgi:type IV pilus assembly protein PilM